MVSDDEFEQYREQYPWIEERRVPLMIVNGEVKLYVPAFGPDRSQPE